MGIFEQCVQVEENKTGYPIETLIQIAQRDNNKKRNFLLVNRKQGKHIGVDPNEALDLFQQLGNEFAPNYRGQKVVVIGFAETATAIGAAVAATFGKGTPYLHTTREQLHEHTCEIVNFQEEHSHAIDQSLYCQCAQGWFREAQALIFIEDEVTTGKTVLNFVDGLKKANLIKADQKIVVASIVNGMDEASMALFQAQGIACHYLVKIAADRNLNPYPHLQGAMAFEPNKGACLKELPLLNFKNKLDPRSGVLIDDYQSACQALGQEVVDYLVKLGRQPKRLLVLGTEEFMYPAIWTGKMIGEHWNGCEVKVHATTRSPIKASEEDSIYPIYNQSKMESLYEAGRVTYVYNLERYDQVVIMTDTTSLVGDSYHQLIEILRHYGCENIMGIRWGT